MPRRALGPLLLSPLLARAALGQSFTPASAPDRPLFELAQSRGFTFGCAVTAQLLADEPQFAGLVAQEAGLLVPEYEAKFATLQPEEGRFDFEPLDALLRWAQHFRKPVRGHALIWHNALPDWVPPALAEGRSRAQRVMETHFDRVLAHTRARIRDWDVVNEPIANPPGSDVPEPAGNTGDLRDTPWLRAFGPDYIPMAFRAARQRDPTLRLTLNDYGVEADSPPAEEKRRRLLRLLRSLRAQNVPLDAVGIQGHLQMREAFSPAIFTTFVREIRALGLQVLITELDVREVKPPVGDFVARDSAVAQRVHAFASAAFEGGARTLLTWGISDRWSWLHREATVALDPGDVHRGLPYDWELNRKQMWRALARAFLGQPPG
ncbi:endo-1,4-beta-xylanase [Falsiroseomonas tokyonensis]|uniref:endo-1,4-beta-xylanase n=1 Tax=Falsiroseomonas tokyonensis TaxID=430521 RepID=A0ABV7BQS4_9PROT|nr:endo-1,4-beta-xylanase [Falsiroseomonas tokyonensis]MBU8537372.1 endo-1,4-beta-xylanase [Falsiroseomonas tokyonensis]